MADPHARISPDECRAKGCTCAFGCRSCGMSEGQMGNCPAWDPCPMGRDPDPNCPLMKVAIPHA
jgi:hypothetical protein